MAGTAFSVATIDSGAIDVVVAPIDIPAASVFIAGTTGDEKVGNFDSSPESDINVLERGCMPLWATPRTPISAIAPLPITAAANLVRVPVTSNRE